MKIQALSNCNVNYNYAQNQKFKNARQLPESAVQPSFQGKFGMITGILTGGAAAVALAAFVAPVLITAGALLGAVGGMAGDKLEDTVNENNENKGAH